MGRHGKGLIVNGCIAWLLRGCITLCGHCCIALLLCVVVATPHVVVLTSCRVVVTPSRVVMLGVLSLHWWGVIVALYSSCCSLWFIMWYCRGVVVALLCHRVVVVRCCS